MIILLKLQVFLISSFVFSAFKLKINTSVVLFIPPLHIRCVGEYVRHYMVGKLVDWLVDLVCQKVLANSA